jgi:hypothetical protein
MAPYLGNREGPNKSFKPNPLNSGARPNFPYPVRPLWAQAV